MTDDLAECNIRIDMIRKTSPFFEEYVEPHSITRIWRCFTLDHFIDELEKRSLFFARASKVTDASDSEIPKFDLKMEDRVTEYLKNFYGKDYETATGEPEKLRERNRKKLRKNTILNCWRMDENDSMEMWLKYMPKSIAISSTIGNLKSSLIDEQFPITFRKVDYLDTVSEGIGRDWIFNAHFFTKKKKWSWEKEHRAVVAENHEYPHQKPYQIGKIGLYADTDFDKLISAIYIAPYANTTIKEIEIILRNHCLEKPVIKSNLKS